MFWYPEQTWNDLSRTIPDDQRTLRMSNKLQQIQLLLERCSPEQRRAIFERLRKEFPIHPVEARLNTKAEFILEAIARDQKGLTFRMMRGVIAEAAFETEVVQKLVGWKDETPSGDLPFDYKLSDESGAVRIQVKLQRSSAFIPMFANQAYRRFPSDMFVVETWKTRRGQKGVTNEQTRHYRFGEFDILAVSLQPSTKRWSDYMYTVERWLIPDDHDPSKILKFQPVSMLPNNDWTDSFEQCVEWFRSGLEKQIGY